MASDAAIPSQSEELMARRWGGSVGTRAVAPRICRELAVPSVNAPGNGASGAIPIRRAARASRFRV